MPEEHSGDGPVEPDGHIGHLTMVILAAIITVAIIFTAVQLFQTVKEPEEERMRVSFVLDDGSSVNFSCEVADNHFERTEGLQHRKELPEGDGMIFIYEEPASVYFIMPNMNFPLDIIFIGEDGTVLNVHEAEPEPPGTPSSEYVRYPSDGEAKWVVEINQGLSRQHGIGPGTQFRYEKET